LGCDNDPCDFTSKDDYEQKTKAYKYVQKQKVQYQYIKKYDSGDFTSASDDEQQI
jgi:hypothetical protein